MVAPCMMEPQSHGALHLKMRRMGILDIAPMIVQKTSSEVSFGLNIFSIKAECMFVCLFSKTDHAAWPITVKLGGKVNKGRH